MSRGRTRLAPALILVLTAACAPVPPMAEPSPAHPAHPAHGAAEPRSAAGAPPRTTPLDATAAERLLGSADANARGSR
jgi:hypothetical protein